MNESGYPVRGWLNGMIEGTCELEEVETIVLSWIEGSCVKGYQEGLIDGRNQMMDEARKLCSDKREGTLNESEIQSEGVGRVEKDKALESAFLGKVVKAFSEVAASQEEKGIKKYGHELRPMDDYDWLEMAMEELVDAVKYLQAEKVKRVQRDMVWRD